MQDLVKLFESFGFSNVTTYLQTGNVLFDSDETGTDIILKVIDNGIFEEIGYKVTIMIRTRQELMDIVESEPYKDYNGDVKYYITFLASKSKQTPPIPIRMNDIENEVFKLDNDNVFTVGFNVKGRYGFPNLFIEKKFGVPATTRNWNTILRILK